MRLSYARRLALVLAALVAGSCDSGTTAGPANLGRATIAVPRTFVRGHDVIAAQTTSNRSTNTEVVKLRLRISIVGDGRQLLDRILIAQAVCGDENQSEADACLLSVQFPFPNGSANATFEFLIDAVGLDGSTIFQVGPTQFTLDANGHSPSVESQAIYIGPGKDATGVLINPRSLTLAVGSTSPLTCLPTGTSATGADLARVPIEISASNPTVALAAFVGGAIQVTGLSAGTTQVICRLDFGTRAQDQITVTVTGVATNGSIAGVVRNSVTQAALAGATLELRAGAGVVTGTPLQTTVSASDGSFGFLNVPAGTYTIRSTASGFTEKSQTGVVIAGIPTPVAILMDPVSTSGSIQGTVRSSANQAFIPNALVELRAGSVTAGTPLNTATTNSQGGFTFATIPTGTYNITVTASGFTTAIQQGVIVTPTTPATPTILMAPATNGSIAGTVRNASSQAPLQSAVVELRAGSDNTTSSLFAPSVSTNSQGAFSFANLPAGSYTLRATLQGFAEAVTTVTVVAGQAAPGNMSMSANLGTGQVRIVVTWTDASLDLDARLTVPGGDVVYYGRHNSDPFQGDGCLITVIPFACLQHDALQFDPLGQTETILIGQVTTGSYFFHVHNFTSSSSGTPNDSRLTASGAKVDVYFGGSTTAAFRFNVPTGSGNEWRVFSLTGSTPASLGPVNDIIIANHPPGLLRAALDGLKPPKSPRKP